MFSLQAHGMCEWKYDHVHLGMPNSKVVTDGINISIPFLKLMEGFTIQEKFIAYTSDGGYNLKMCQDALEGKVTNATIYRTQQNMFQQDFFAHVLQGACKADILDCKSEDDDGTILCAFQQSKKSHGLCCMDEEEFTWIKSTNKGSKLCWIETTQDVDTYQNTMGIFY